MSKKIDENEILQELNEYLYRTMCNLPYVCDKVKDGEELFHLVDLFEALEYIIFAYEYTQKVLLLNLDKDIISTYMKDILEGVENKDFLLVSEAINYQILPILTDLHKQLQNYFD